MEPITDGDSEVMPARRGFLLGVAAACSGGAAGTAFGYMDRNQLHRWSAAIRSHPESIPSPAPAEFSRHAARIRELQARQTRETVKQLKSKYETAIFGRVRVWDMIEKLGMCVDVSDDTLLLTSQHLHIQQIIEGMERDGVQDRDLFLVALLHDLGKVMLLTDEVPEHIVGFTEPLGEFPRGAGLENVVFQFGHDEMIYSRLKDHVPEHVAWTIRYHSASIGVLEPYLNERDRVWRDRYLAKFTPYDLGSKSSSHFPRVDMAKYRALIEDMFPQPILV